MEDLTPLVDAKRLILEDRSHDALPILLDFVAVHPRSFNAYIFLAAAHLEIGNRNAALDCYRHLREIAPRKIAPYVYAAHILLSQGHATEAVTMIGRGLELSDGSDPENEANGRGYIAYVAKDWVDAEHYFLLAKGLRDNPSEPYLLLRIAEVQFELKKFEEAERNLELLKSLHAAKGNNLRLLARLKRQRGDKAGSYAELEQAIGLDGNDKESLGMMALFLLRDFRLRDAIKYARLHIEITDRETEQKRRSEKEKSSPKPE